MNERQHLELVQRDDIYIKIGAGYRLITDKRDGAGDLIDLGYNLYTTTDPQKGYQKFLDGPKGDLELPMGAVPIPPARPSALKQFGRDSDELFGMALNISGCLLKGCGWYIAICIGLSLIGFIAMLLGAEGV